MRSKRTVFTRSCCIAVLSALLISTSSFAGKPAPTKPLYDRLGGTYGIAAVVDTFIDLMLVNDVLNANPHIKKALVPAAVPGLKYLITELVCEKSGGPCKYTGKSMAASHAGLKITDAEWDAFVADFVRTLNFYGVPKPEQKELIDVVAATRGDIVGK